jgi:predicted enzyme related to lactoylglutathione lyase
MDTTLAAARAALSAVSARTADLIALAPDTTARLRRSSRTVREAAVHLAVVGFRYAAMVHGERIQFPSLAPDEYARHNDELNADIPETRSAPLAALVREGTADLLAATASATDARTVLFDGGVELSVVQLIGVAVAEHLRHGTDLAAITGRPWPIDPAHAALSVDVSPKECFMPTTATISLTLDCADPGQLSAFWASALGYAQLATVDNFVVLGPPAEVPGPKLALQGVPEGRSPKNRMHLDIWVDDIEAEAARLEALGATRLRDEPFAEHGLQWIQLADPEGNEFCVGRA